MKLKTISLLLLSCCLAGCPPIYNINLKNEASNPIVVLYPYNGKELLTIPGNGGEGEEIWDQYCFALKEEGKKLYFISANLPKEAYEKHYFSTSVYATYKNGKLNYMNKQNELVKVVDGVEKCN